MSTSPYRTTHAVMAALVAASMVVCSLWVVRPFLPATIWAITIVVTTWPLLLRIQALLWKSRALAVTVTTLIALLVFVMPFWLATTTVIAHGDDLKYLIRAALAFRVPPEPQWLPHFPLIGSRITEVWQQVENLSLSQLAPRLTPYAGRLIGWSIGYLGSFGMLALQFFLTLIMTAIIHTKGEAASRLAMKFGDSLAGDEGRQMVSLAGRAIRAVAVGVMVTALVEAIVGGIGIKLSGAPWPAVLTAMTFIVCLAQAGPGIILIPVIVWVYVFRDMGHAVMLLVFTVAAILIDCLLRPYLIRRQADVPMLLIMVGVIGGLSMFGLIGIFVGPVILAVTYTLIKSWMGEDSVLAGDTHKGTPVVSK
jgi:predicted PurR-regulated permease PerM